jgi:hypothetical protein
MYERVVFRREPLNEWNQHLLVWKCPELSDRDFHITDEGYGVISYYLIKFGGPAGDPIAEAHARMQPKCRVNYARVIERQGNMISCQRVPKREAGCSALEKLVSAWQAEKDLPA